MTVQAIDHISTRGRQSLSVPFRYIVAPTVVKAILKHFHIYFIKYLKSMEITGS